MAYVLQLAAISMLAQVVIICGVGFISGQLFPQALAAVYGATGPAARTAMAAVAVFPAANYLIAHVYAHYNPGHAAIMTVVAVTVSNAAFAMLVMQQRLTWQLALALLCLAASAAWASRLMGGTGG